MRIGWALGVGLAVVVVGCSKDEDWEGEAKLDVDVACGNGEPCKQGALTTYEAVGQSNKNGSIDLAARDEDENHVLEVVLPSELVQKTSFSWTPDGVSGQPSELLQRIFVRRNGVEYWPEPMSWSRDGDEGFTLTLGPMGSIDGVVDPGLYARFDMTGSFEDLASGSSGSGGSGTGGTGTGASGTGGTGTGASGTGGGGGTGNGGSGTGGSASTCGGSTSFNGTYGNSCSFDGPVPMWHCTDVGGLIYRHYCNANTCLWEGMECVPQPNCTQACGGVAGGCIETCGI